MHGAGDAAAVDAACCILPLFCHGLHCRGVSGSCLSEPMGKRALVNFNHLQTFAVTKEHISKGYFFSSTLCITLVLQKYKDVVACYPGSLDKAGLQGHFVFLSDYAVYSFPAPLTSQKYSQRANFKDIIYDSPLRSRNAYLNIRLHSGAKYGDLLLKVWHAHNTYVF